jgi:hypothetical protein
MATTDFWVPNGGKPKLTSHRRELGGSSQRWELANNAFGLPTVGKTKKTSHRWEVFSDHGAGHVD